MEGILRSIAAADYSQLSRCTVALFRYDDLTDTFPDEWRLCSGQVIRRHGAGPCLLAVALSVLHSGVSASCPDVPPDPEATGPLPADVRSYALVRVEVHGVPWGILWATSPQTAHFNLERVSFLEGLGRQVGALIQELPLHAMDSVELATVRVLAATVDAKDPYTRHHSTNVAFYAGQIGRAMNLDPAEIRQIELAALLHDIGKIAIPDQILQKPGELTDQENLLIHTHSPIGATMLAQATHLRHLVPLVRHHHEWYDGTGYPDRLKGLEIPLGAAILGVADAFDTMTTRRVYRSAMTLEQALGELRRCSGTQFHPDVINALEELISTAKERQERWLQALGGAQDPTADSELRKVLPIMQEGAPSADRDPLDFLANAEILQAILDLPAILERSGQQIQQFWSTDLVQIYLINRETGMLSLAWSGGSDRADRLLNHCRREGPLPLSSGLLGWAALTNQGISVPDTRRDHRWRYGEQLDRPASVLAIPISGRGSALGVMQILSAGENQFGRKDMKVLKLFGCLLGQVLEQSLRSEGEREAAYVDPVTGMRNANFIWPLLERLEREPYDGPVSIAYIDGDDLKSISEKHGYEAGEMAVQHIARCLLGWQREEDLVVRCAGDEFMILFPGLSLPEAAARTEEIRMAIAEVPLKMPDGTRRWISVSCGVTEIDAGRGPNQAVRAAEQAMYRAKRSGKNRVWTVAG